MKKFTIGLFSKIITFLVFAVFFVPLMGISFYFAFLYPQTPYEERLIFLAGVVMFGGLVVFAIYRMFYLGLVWVEYDMEKVILHYSRKEEYKFQWEEIPGSRVQVERAGGGYVFYVQRNGRQREIPLNCLSKGYKDFEKTLELTGVLHRIGVKTQEEFKKDAERVFEQYQKYREAHPGSASLKPEGNCVICSDCQGKGLHLKKLSLLKVDVGKVCKTCGGFGYLPAYVSDFVEIPADNIIKESRTETPGYCDKQYIVYMSLGDSRKKIRVNTYYLGNCETSSQS
ncbi:MAG: hypothetical protein K2N00_12275 [Lachnospiraceae bacterium]|nr:hypothetical protein [Lachnospiraceae bacterium]